nr:hypothetical protein [Salipiger mucosus]
MECRAGDLILQATHGGAGDPPPPAGETVALHFDSDRAWIAA